ncbi:MAG: flagellar hook-associated protein FlgK [Oleiphilaceae bacterium]|nr:flagellar hook-associated protein FlgK [Oleiphilaceae bacterium]
MAGLIGIGLTGLKAHQTALSVTGNNVANVNTDGYSRQEAIFEDNISLPTGVGFVGQGVNIETIRRVAQDFVVEQLRADTTVYNERKAVMDQAEAIDNLLASSTTGLTPALSSFFQALQGAADDPTSIPQRQLLLTQAEGLVSRFHSLDQRLRSQLDTINQELEASVAEINSLAQSLAELNVSIASVAGAAQGSQPNNLLDERDEVLRQLSELVSVSVFRPGDDGQVNVFIGNGQPLVVGSRAIELAAVQSPSDPTEQDVALIVNGSPQVISRDISGGKIGGLLAFRDGTLSDAINGMGRIALVVADSVNDQHALGMDLEDALGGLFFSDVNALGVARNRVTPNSNNEPPDDQVLRVNILDIGALTADDYELRFEGPTDSDFTIVRAGSGELVAKSVLPNIYPANYEFEGLQLQFESGTFKVGDTFSLQPTRGGAADIELEINRVEQIALASPVRAFADPGNEGNAQISAGRMLDVNNPITNQPIPILATENQLSPPLGIRFLNDMYYEVVDISDPANPAPLDPPMNNQLYVRGVSNQVFTSDPGQTRVSATGSDALQVPPAAPSAGPLVNGYGAQNLTFLTRDTSTGVVTSQVVSIAANSSAETIATNLSAIQGVEASAYTQIELSNFVDDGDPTPLGMELNGEVLTVVAPDVFGPDALADLINSNTTLQDQNIVAVSDGTTLSIRAFTGVDLEVVVTGAGDSIDVSSVDPYTAGKPVLSTQTVASGQGVSVGGAIDVSLAEGVSFTADVESVFTAAPVAESSYYGFQFSIKGEPETGDRFNIDYNAGGISDNRNALALAQLEGAGFIANGIVTYGEAYSQIVEEVGTVTNRARLDTDSAKALLDQSKNNRESISGVNLDEEAGRLVQFQAAYNASAQVVSIARELFDTLLNTFR